MQDGLKKAVGVPLSLAERVTSLWPALKEIVQYGNVACKSDAQVRLWDRPSTHTHWVLRPSHAPTRGVKTDKSINLMVHIYTTQSFTASGLHVGAISTQH